MHLSLPKKQCSFLSFFPQSPYVRKPDPKAWVKQTKDKHLDGDRINTTEVTRRDSFNPRIKAVLCLETPNGKTVAKQRIKLYNCCSFIVFLSKPFTMLLVSSQHQAVQASQSDLWHFLFDLLRAQISPHLFYSSQVEQQSEGDEWKMQQNIQDLHSASASSCFHLLSSAVVSQSRVEHLLHFATWV